jgi:hypothetical protein
MDEFNREYSSLLGILESSFNGKPGNLNSAISTMLNLKTLAQKLMSTQIDDGSGETLAPSFQYFPYT